LTNNPFCDIIISPRYYSERVKKMKKLLAIIIAAIMLVSVFAFNASAATETKTLEVKWNAGYVGSATNANWTNKINPTGGSYSYSDIIDMGPAGSTITFTDTIPGFASNAAYTISVWTKSGDDYVLDTTAANVVGVGGNGKNVYNFVTTEDNQGIRISYRSEQSDSLTPVFEDVYVDGVKVDTTWAKGYVKPDGTVTSGNAYSRSEVIVVAKKGSVVSFADTNKNGSQYASSGAAVFSTWKQEGGNWVYAGTSVNGDQARDTLSSTENVTYTYTSTKDNEYVRLCYQSLQSTSYTPADSARPVVTLTSPVAETTAAATTSAPTTTAAPVTTAAPATTTAPSVTPAPETGDATSVVVLASLIAVITLAGVTVGKKR
jgi:hypothetical protein